MMLETCPCGARVGEGTGPCNLSGCGELSPPDVKPIRNVKDAIGSSKVPMALFPKTAIIGGALALLDGMLKYGKANYRAAPELRASIYSDALERHIGAFQEGEDIDPDSGLPHLFHVLACAAILIDAEAADNLLDDRAVPGGYRKFLDEMTPHVERLKAKHADKNPVHHLITGPTEGDYSS